VSRISCQPRSVSFVKRVARAALRTRLIEPGDRILVAVSGGPDSMALLSVLADLAEAWSFTLWVAHFNYSLRQAESDEDERFVVEFCARRAIPCRCQRLDLTFDREQGGGRSLQEYARELRYEALLRLAGEFGANKIALGHTADDQAETVLMWMLRGAGTSGLAGIRARRAPCFVRPLLDFSRADILAYLEEERLSFRMDSSNAKPIYLRNRVRLELLPALKRLNPGIVGVLNRQAAILLEEDRYLDEVSSEQVSRLAHREPDGAFLLDREQLTALPLAIQRRVLRHALRLAGGSVKGAKLGGVTAALERIVHGRSGAELTVHGVRVARSYNLIRIGPDDSQEAEWEPMAMTVSVPDAIEWPLTGQILSVKWGDPAASAAGQGSGVAILDADRFTPDLRVRSWREGDLFCPLGMAGRRKKLQDFFVDLKVPRGARGRVPLVEAPEGIVWVGGYRIDHRFRVTPSTRRTVIMQLGAPDQPSTKGKGARRDE
jgi:tRNA(Ile)-lysidine synthase